MQQVLHCIERDFLYDHLLTESKRPASYGGPFAPNHPKEKNKKHPTKGEEEKRVPEEGDTLYKVNRYIFDIPSHIRSFVTIHSPVG